MLKLIQKIKSKLRNSSGVTLTELLASSVVLMLTTALLATTTSVALRQYRLSLRNSEAQMLCSTLSSIVNCELAYTNHVYDQSGLITYDSNRYGVDKAYFTYYTSDSDSGSYGEIALHSSTDSSYAQNLLGSGSYSQGMLAKMYIKKYESGVFTVVISIGTDSEEYLKKEFQIHNVNNAPLT